jgi:hypothetical protein
MAILNCHRWPRIPLLAGGIFLSLLSTAEAQSLQLYEQKIKAGLVYNFLKYTEWPSSKMTKDTPAVIVCIFGQEDPFDGYLSPIEERTVQQKPITLKYISDGADINSCHMLYIGASDKAHWPQLQTAAGNKGILTVGDFSGFTDSGGMIQLGNKNNRVYVELNIAAITTAHLHIYDTLRRIATITHPTGE